MKKPWPFEDISIFRNEGCWGEKKKVIGYIFANDNDNFHPNLFQIGHAISEKKLFEGYIVQIFI